MFPIDPLLFKLIQFWGAIASILIDGAIVLMALAWLDDWRRDRVDTQAKVLFWMFATSALLAFLFLACQSGILKPLGAQ